MKKKKVVYIMFDFPLKAWDRVNSYKAMEFQ